MNFFLRWLEDEPRGWRLVRFLLAMLAVSLWYSLLVTAVRNWLDPSESMMTGLPEMVVYRPWEVFFWAGLEELLFRLPLVVPLMFQRKHLTFITVIMYAALFGYAHGGVQFILLQGVAGLLLSLVFIRCGGWRWGKTLNPIAPFKAMACSTIVHGFYNILIVLIILLRNGYFS